MKFSTYHPNFNLFRALSWLLVGMSTLFLVIQALVAAIHVVVNYMFQHSPSKINQQ